MPDEKRKPVAGKATGFLNIERLGGAIDGLETNPQPLTWQASYVAAKYGLTPCVARLICHLAEIGGRLA